MIIVQYRKELLEIGASHVKDFFVQKIGGSTRGGALQAFLNNVESTIYTSW